MTLPSREISHPRYTSYLSTVLRGKTWPLQGRGQKCYQRPREQSLQYWRYGIYHAQKSEEEELKFIHRLAADTSEKISQVKWGIQPFTEHNLGLNHRETGWQRALR